ncbi:hypothetical protein ACET3Z_022492 [Daucus carota]
MREYKTLEISRRGNGILILVRKFLAQLTQLIGAGKRVVTFFRLIKHVHLNSFGEADDFSENKKMDSYQGGSRSPTFNDTYERRYTDRPSPGGRSDDRNYRSSYDERRSPGSNGDYGRSPARTEIVND